MVVKSFIVVSFIFGRKAKGARSNIECDTLILDNESTSDTIPYNEVFNDNIH